MIEPYEGILTMPNFIGLCLFAAFIGGIFFITQIDYVNDSEKNYYKQKRKNESANARKARKMGDRGSQVYDANARRLHRIINRSRNR